jgi:hypothetical protein
MELLRDFRTSGCKTPVLIVTARNSLADRVSNVSSNENQPGANVPPGHVRLGLGEEPR